MALEAGVGTVVIDNERRRRAAGRARRRAAPADPRDARASTPTPTSTSSPARPARSSAWRRTPPARSPSRDRASPGCTCTSARSCARSTRTAAPWRRSPASATSASTTSAAGSACPTCRATTCSRRRDWVAGVVGRRARRARARTCRSCSSPAGRSSPTPASTLYRVESVKPGAAGEQIVAVDGGMSDNLRPMLYGAAYDAALADRIGAGGVRCTVVGKHCESGDVLVRDVELPDPRPGDVLVTPATGAYGHAMANNYNGVPRPPVIFCSGGDARVGRAPRDLRGPAVTETFRVGLLGPRHGRLGVRRAARRARRRDRARSPACARRSVGHPHALARRLRGDPRRART